MALTDPDRQIESRYPIVMDISVRVSDLDGYGHLNAIRLGHYYEEARASFYGIALKGIPRVRTVVGQLTIRYLREGFWPGSLRCATGIERIGSASFDMVQALFQNGRCIGVCDTTVVNTADGASAPLPPLLRARLTELRLKAPALAD
ncbi:acyl-CoA thioesterase [Zavarzinia sp. CC-PAN008]|uniref:acyl-CoA thioesterase n=1 Tax=Zavarzinia sp. CC-PAN008 TaxID=3243332 RepID=UPI003F7431E7